jgi:hypothetical protein
LTPSKEIEELQSRRANLEEESRQLDDKERELDERVKILEEKLAIQALEEHNRTKLDAIKNLEAKMCELEQKVKTPKPKEPEAEPEAEMETATPPEKPVEEAMEPAEEIATEEEEPKEEYVDVTPIEDVTVTPQAEEIEEESRKQHDKKKRKFF